jgi:ribosomal protein L37AE/L43A
MTEQSVGDHRVPPAQRGPESWKTGCPEGHVSTVPRVEKGGYYCDSCKQHYEGEPISRVGGEFGD